MKNVYLGLGTNLGDRKSNLENALALIEKSMGTIIKASSLYETEPWGFSAEDQFINMVVKIRTGFAPSELLDKILYVESLLGRERGKKQYSSRVIDIDILLYNNEIINAGNLKIPHPRMQLRKFVMVPLCEIAPEVKHPVLGKSFKELLDICEDQSSVEKLG